jgi:hypothetical protein
MQTKRSVQVSAAKIHEANFMVEGVNLFAVDLHTMNRKAPRGSGERS